MKKVYTKPIIIFESFSLSRSIATCEITDPKDDRLHMTGEGYAFTASSCDFDVTNGGGDGEHNGICYNVPSGENLFNS